MPAAQTAIESVAPTMMATLGTRRCSIQPAARLPATFTIVTTAVTIAAVEVEKPSRSTCRVGRKPTTANQQRNRRRSRCDRERSAAGRDLRHFGQHGTTNAATGSSSCRVCAAAAGRPASRRKRRRLPSRPHRHDVPGRTRAAISIIEPAPAGMSSPHRHGDPLIARRCDAQQERGIATTTEMKPSPSTTGGDQRPELTLPPRKALREAGAVPKMINRRGPAGRP